jgi:Zn-finger nucleic acid-binding protein
MKRESNTKDVMRMELKYCERCGGLWLRPVGGGQVYCVGCGREMAELPPASYEAESARMPRGPRWGADEGETVRYEDDEGLYLISAGGGA